MPAEEYPPSLLTVPESALIVLGALEHLTGERDRDNLPMQMMKLLADISGAEESVLFLAVEGRFEPVIVVGEDGEACRADPDIHWPRESATLKAALAALSQSLGECESILLDNSTVAHGLRDIHGLTTIVTLRYPDGAPMRPWWIGSFLKIYQNHVNLINDAECDSLTGLFNRKSFEARMNGVLAAQREAHANWQFGAGERRAARPNEHHWLAVLDVDGFRSVNDRFGHLYGDDVLMLLARQMMRSFRLEDRLFRFGGKEFVILLSPCAAAGAAKLFERFRSVMEDYEFPRAERLTVSIGFCRILPEDAASIALGRAGEALHYAKRNGRNRVCSFEPLAATGDVHEPGVAASAPARN